MFRFLALLACVAAALASPTHLDDRVIGGQTAGEGQFPYMASIRWKRDGGLQCGGSIIHYNFVLTAAHCVYQNHVGDFVIVVGTNRLSSGGVLYDLSTAVYHSEFNPQFLQNDIALLKTVFPIAFGPLVQPISLHNSDVPEGVTVTLSGWGITHPGQGMPDRLQFIDLIAMDNKQCHQHLGNPVFQAQICTFTRQGEGSCNGDSGGPLVWGGNQVGIVSYGIPCALGKPDIFARVSSFIPWITANMV